ncbi:DUF3558 family protein [Rhodococcoides corynebacterioides]
MGSGGNRPRAGGVQRVVRTVGVGLACAVVAGCGGGVVGTPVAELWDPCSLSAEALTRVGVQPRAAEPQQVQNGSNTWRFCSYTRDWAVLTVIATTTPFESVSEDPRALDIRSVDLNGEPGIQFVLPEPSPLPSCYVSAALPVGSVQFRVAESGISPPTAGVCDTAVEVARGLYPETER